MCEWKIKRFNGGAEHVLVARIVLNEPVTPSLKREIGPVSMEFEVPMWSCSNVQINFLRCAYSLA
jgi:AP-4 complex subunit mu-1